MDADLLGRLEVLRREIYCPTMPLAEVCALLRSSCLALSSMEQSEALDITHEAVLSTADTVPLLRRAVTDDPDEVLEAAALTAQLTTILSGYGEHTTIFAFGSLRIRLLVQPQAAGTATRVWHAARLAAWACDTEWAGFRVRGRTAVELGCGTAAAGLACAALGAQQVVLTDNDEAALKLAWQNAKLNELAQCTVARLDLMSPAPLESLPRAFDVVIASDVLYDLTAAASVAAVIARLLAHSAAARALVVSSRNPKRSAVAQRAVNEFISLCAAHPELQCVDELSTSEGLAEGDGDLVMLLLAPRFQKLDSGATLLGAI